MHIFDQLKAKPVVEDEFKVLHLNKAIPGVFVYFPKENTLLLNSKMLKIYEDFDFKKNIGHGILAYDHTQTNLDLYLNYNVPLRLDLENGEKKYLYIFFDPENPESPVLDASIDTAYAKDRVFDKLILQFIIGNEDVCDDNADSNESNAEPKQSN